MHTQPKPTGLRRLTIHHRLPDGPAFAHVEGLEGTAYIPRSTANALRLKRGDRVRGAIVSNVIAPEKTPWYAPHAIYDEAAGPNPDVETLRHLLFDCGGVWPLSELARHLAAPGDDGQGSDAGSLSTRAYLAAEILYEQGGVAKFMRFDSPSGPVIRIWYTTNPDRADVDEWDDDA